MPVYSYDGSFEGLLCAYSGAFQSKEIPDDFQRDGLEENLLFSDKIRITADAETSDKFAEKVRRELDKGILNNIIYMYLSETGRFEIITFRYLELLFREGLKAATNLSDKVIMPVYRVCRKVGFEAHRLKGLIRFRKLKDGVFYAPIEPDHNVLTLISPHFAQRYRGQSWLIHDKKRGTASIYNGRQWKIVIIENHDFKESEVYDENELLYQELWKTYYRAVAIQERKNPRLQRQLMPRRYWKYLIEKEAE